LNDAILEILLEAQRYAVSLGGRLSARVIVWPSEIVNVHVDYERIPNRGTREFSVGTHRSELEELRRELMWMLDHFIGFNWREAGEGGGTNGIIETLIRAQKYVESRIGLLKAKIMIVRQFVDIQVELQRIRKRRLKAEYFGIGKRVDKLDELPELLEMMLDVYLGPEWREEK
jgi:hypothetical protein